MKSGILSRPWNCFCITFLFLSFCWLACGRLALADPSLPSPTSAPVTTDELAKPASPKAHPKPSSSGEARSSSKSNRPVVGWIEKVALAQGAIVLNAKLDTGADYSSLHAHDIEEFERDGVVWVRFQVIDRIGRDIMVERRVIRTTSIKRMGGKSQKRNVIRMGLCLGDIYLKSDVNLVDRSDFKLQMLLGRNFLAGSVSIDPAISFTTEPRCNAYWTADDILR